MESIPRATRASREQINIPAEILFSAPTTRRQKHEGLQHTALHSRMRADTRLFPGFSEFRSFQNLASRFSPPECIGAISIIETKGL